MTQRVPPATSVKKRAEEALRRMSRYLDLFRDLVCTAGLDGYFKQLNGMWTETLRSVRRRTAIPPDAVLCPSGRPPGHPRRAGECARAGDDRCVREPVLDEGRWLAVDRLDTRYAPDERLIDATARNITERREAESQSRFVAQERALQRRRYELPVVPVLPFV